MEKHKLIYKIEDKIPELLSKIHLDKVYYDAQRRRALVLLLSDEPLGEEIFLQVKRIIAKNLRGVRVSLRIAAPKSGQAFLENPSLYADIITKALARKYPSLESWKDEISWKSHEGAIIVELPDAFSLQYARENTIQQTIEKVIEGVFQIKPPLILEVKGDTQKRMKRIEEERNKERILAQEAIRKKLEIAEVKRTVKKKQSPKIYGRIIKGKPVEIATLTETSGTVIIAGRLMDVERKDVSGGEIVLLTFILNDLTGSIKCKVFMRYRSRWKKMAENQPGDITQAEISKLEKTIESIQNSQGLLVSGECQMDTFERDLVVMINDISTFDLPVRRDNAEQKRIELHAHTQMSNMDATVSASDLIQQAAKWGHPAIAITDSGVVQAFPEAFLAAQKYNIKLIPGLEGYMIDRGKAVKLPDERPLNSAIVVLDFETTGLNIHTDRMIEFYFYQSRYSSTTCYYRNHRNYRWHAC
jgi:DNA polymerase-3 subunit alpha (Gram-positive type)